MCYTGRNDPPIRSSQEQYDPRLRRRQYATYAAGVESLISQGVRAGDLRRTRYIGLARTHLQQVLMAVGISLVRVVEWLLDPTPAPKRQAHFAALAPTG